MNDVLIKIADTVLDGAKYYAKEDVFLTGLVVDPKTKFAFGAFPALKKSSPATIGFFDTEAAPIGSSPKFNAFPTWRDNDLPVGDLYLVTLFSD